MSEIWKFPLMVTDVQIIEIPRMAKLLTVQLQGGRPCLWAAVTPRAPRENRQIITHGTGHEMSSAVLGYIGTYQLEGGALVFHVFDGGEE